MKKRQYRRVQVCTRLNFAYTRHFLEGVERFVEESKNYKIRLLANSDDPIRDKAISGVLSTYPLTPAYIGWLQRRGIPMVGFRTRIDIKPKYTTFYLDNAAVGGLAADHFLARGFDSFAYIHSPTHPESELRGEGFAERLREHNARCDWFVIDAQPPERLTQFNSRVNQWLSTRTTPLAILAFNDMCGSRLLNAIAESELTCPGNVALLGVDNDELLCRLNKPALSSIDTNWSEAGYKAAIHLHQMIEDKLTKPILYPIPPKGVALRASTDFLAINDKQVRNALCFIREHISEPFHTKEVLAKVNIGRDTLDSRFVRYLGHTVSDEIVTSRVRRAKTLLRETNMTIEAVAYECGFEYPDRLFCQFKRRLGMTPGEYRKRVTLNA